jgi:adenine phosphoribosyltransferase
MLTDINNIKNCISEINNFPKDGILFRDISPLLQSENYFHDAVTLMGKKVKTPKYWVGIESRGFIFASALSMIYGGGVLLCRKKGKLPPPVISIDYDLEYGSDTLQIKPGDGDVVIVDDVLATGGTLNAVENLVIKAGYTVIDKLVLIDLKYLNNITDVKSLIIYE